MPPCASRRASKGTAVIVGGESMHAAIELARRRPPLPGRRWSAKRESAFRARICDEPNRQATRDRSGAHISALRSRHAGRMGTEPCRGFEQSAALWARYAEVAANNPAAWIRTAPTAQDIAAIGDDNRPICWPYPKLMVANPNVNQAAAIIVTSLEEARAAGVPDDRMVFIWGGAAATEPMIISRGTAIVTAALRPPSSHEQPRSPVETPGGSTSWSFTVAFPWCPRWRCARLGWKIAAYRRRWRAGSLSLAGRSTII